MTMDKTPIPPNDNSPSPTTDVETNPLKEAYMRGYLKEALTKGLFPNCTVPTAARNRIPDGQHGSPWPMTFFSSPTHIQCGTDIPHVM